MDINTPLQQLGPGMILIGISLNLLFQGRSLHESRKESTKILGTWAFICGIILFLVGLAAVISATGKPMLVLSAVLIFIVAWVVFFFAMRRGKQLKVR